MPQGALFNVKVVDLSENIAGPYCTKLFADYGAEVIKVEKPSSGDPARRLGPFLGDIPHPEKSGMFLHLNTNKKSVTLNLESTTGKKILRQLVKDADILVESYPPLTSQALGITWGEMEKVNPNLVMASITNFGQYGPYRDYKATDMLIYAAGGILYVTGDGPEREPAKIGNYATLYLCGNAAAALTICAFYGARYNGLGQHVDISLMEQIAGSMDRGGCQLLAVAYTGALFMQRAGVLRMNIIPPSQAVPCEDGYVWLMPTLVSWPKFAELIGHPEFLTEPRFQNLYDLSNAGDVDAAVLEYTMQHGKEEIQERAQAMGIPAAAVNTPEELFRNPQLRFRGFFVETEHPEAGKFEALGAPFIMEKTPWRAGRAPLLGEHNVEILGDRLGYSKQDLVIMREREII